MLVARRNQFWPGRGWKRSDPTFLLSVVIAVTFVNGIQAAANDIRDTRESEDVTLECRFTPIEATRGEELTYYWSRNNKQNHDNVAIGKIPLDTNYKLDYHPEQGRYDLHISNTTYDRDNGKFECRVKEGGSGNNLHSQSYVLTVLTPPQLPRLVPGPYVTATEGKRQDLTCSSLGGSPDPLIRWYRDGTSYPLEASFKSGGSRDQPTSSILSITPGREDDGAVFRCVVWNRAMPDGKKLEATITLSVNYYPRVEIGPENPLRVEKDSTATLVCNVDAKPKVTSVRWNRNGRFISTAMSHTIHRVSLQDAGKYMCSAENGLGKTGEKEILLDVLYGPVVTLDEKTRSAEEGENVEIKCNVTANPTPNAIEWIKEGRSDFLQKGPVLRLPRVTADNSGTYICRASNVITPSSQTLKSLEKVGNASIAVLIRHKPGKARISPDKPIANEGASVTLTCTANPPGWPAPQIRWFRDEGPQGQTVLATGSKYNIPRVTLSSEGMYHCQATNELGLGEEASIMLEVRQPPRFIAKLPPHTTRRVGDSEFSVACSALGKPRPTIKWLKDGTEITPDVNLFEVKTDTQEGRNGVFTVQSNLDFKGKARPDMSQLLADDRGVYSCVFENEVKRAETSMQLKIEHEPMPLHQYNKVAFDIGETAEVICKIQAYPKPEFKWFVNPNQSPLQMSSDGHYEINTTTNNNDIYTSMLKIGNLKPQDYGDYTCAVINSLGTTDTKIRLQPKGPPERPRSLSAINVGHDFVTLFWEPGFNGGLANTKYFVSYRKVPGQEDNYVEGCGAVVKSGEWQEIDCGQNIPCNVTMLEQHHNYVFKVKALNTKGTSEFSDETGVITKVDSIPLPQHVVYDPSAHGISINIDPTCLPLIAIVEIMTNDNLPIPTWQVVVTLPIDVSGMEPTFKEISIDNVNSARYYKNVGRSLEDDDDEPVGISDDFYTRVRVKLCLKHSATLCSEYVEADIGSSYVKEASALNSTTIVVIVVCCVICLLSLGLVLMFCRCKRQDNKKTNAASTKSSKDYEMDSVRPTIVSQQSQAPPPYYPTSGMENKALEHSMDLGLGLEDSKNSVYATQNGYGYHVANANIPNHPVHQNINGEWVNVGYMDNYSNSNNGGSVNSQDSLWQMKMAASGGLVSGNNTINQHHIDRANAYAYDPLHGAYVSGVATDDYAPYPHLQTNGGVDDYHMHAGNGQSRVVGDDYCSDPYASVHKPKKRLDQHIAESPYHDVSGLPDPYLEQMDDEKPPQHMSLNYEESLESGYSTPNSRTRRVIREIIV